MDGSWIKTGDTVVSKLFHTPSQKGQRLGHFPRTSSNMKPAGELLLFPKKCAHNSSRAKLFRLSILGCLLFQLMHFNTDPVVSPPMDYDEQPHPFSTMASPNQLAFYVEEGLSLEVTQNSTNDDRCNDILLFMPYTYSINGQGAQLNSYLHASLLATFLDKPLVVVESPDFHIIPEWSHHFPEDSLYDSGSQFGCPADYFNSDPNVFPLGLSRLIQIPQWISRGCGVPTCNGKFRYHNWESFRRADKQYFIKNHVPNVKQCVEGDKVMNITVAGGGLIRHYFLSLQQTMLDRTTRTSREAAKDWAMRLGASVDEAKGFASLSSSTAIWDYLSALINRSGLLKFQPWIARDIGEYIQSSHINTETMSYDAIHVRRGDKLLIEAKGEVRKYWRSKGYIDEQTWPTQYIPFARYLERGWNSKKCKTRGHQKRKSLNADPRTVFVATDDPATVISEIEALSKSLDGYPIIDNCGHKANFVLSPSSRTATSFHINDRSANGECSLNANDYLRSHTSNQHIR